MTTKPSREEEETDSKDRLPKQTSLDTATSPPPSMSAAVASADTLKTTTRSQQGSTTHHPSASSLVVMNPLVPTSSHLPRRASLHVLPETEPALKKRKLGDATAPPPPSVSEGNSSCDSIQSKRQPASATTTTTSSRSQGGGGGGEQDTHHKKDAEKHVQDPSNAKLQQGGGDVAAKQQPQASNNNNDDATAMNGATLKPSATEKNTCDANKPATVAAPATTTTTAATTKSQTGGATTIPPSSKPGEKPPLKSTKMSHLRQKYTGELEYMLREFEKLERQLLGARKTEESAASRERREKLHSFILHLTETIQQIEKGCELEAAGQCTLPATLQQNPATDTAADTALANPSQDKEEEENVQKLEEHILANLLPVKVRLKKQLAAQQGAKHNPATMPHRAGVSAATSTPAGTTFADSARRQQQEAAKAATVAESSSVTTAAPPVAADQTQFGKPLVKGSNLTKKLHGPTLGSSQRAHGDGVGVAASCQTSATTEKKKYYGGLAVGSAQMESSFDAASNVHEIVIQDPALVLQSQGVKEEASKTEPLDKEDPVQMARTTQDGGGTKPAAVVQFPNGASVLTDERHRKLRRKKRKKMRLKEKAKAAAVEKRELEKGRKQKAAKKSHRGPRHVEYMCALCNEVYNSTCEYNPWWALAQHDCPKCRKRQIPRIDIGAPSNAIEYHPALLAHADDNGGVAPAERCTVAEVAEVTPSSAPSNDLSDDDSLGNSDISSDYADISTDDDVDSLDSENDELEALSPADRAEQERFGADYGGPALEDREASRLLILMSHASTCPCQHKSHNHREVCRSVKWMMLHVRDCPGTTSNFDVCPFPWCRKVKHLLYHLVSCQEPATCKICAPADLGRNLLHLKELNNHRERSYRHKLLAKLAPGAAPQAAQVPASTATEVPKAGSNVAAASSQDGRADDIVSDKAEPVSCDPGTSNQSAIVDGKGSKERADNSPAVPPQSLVKQELDDAQRVIKQEPDAQLVVKQEPDAQLVVKQEPDAQPVIDAAPSVQENPVDPVAALMPAKEETAVSVQETSVLKSETSPASIADAQPSPLTKKQESSGKEEISSKDGQQDSENKEGQAPCSPTSEKVEEPSKSPTEDASKAECGALAEIRKRGENTPEPLQVQ